ncbi:MAG TPA: NAD(P)/FAD-dependent oxidoreductase [Nevskiaceae bacterium]|nr:NAD(P)/FAD-dependent oxidoreductase [Nevskiaceae bacterium]
MAFDAARSSRKTQTPDVLVIGTGFAGLCMGIRLKQSGREDFVILERAGAIGGTWRDNDYPGCACDVQSHLYSFSFEPNPEWTRMFARQPEIRAYLEKCVDKYGLAPHIQLGREVVSARFDEASGRWQVRTRDGSRYSARVLVSGMGGLSNPAFPSIPGLERFAGRAFHSAQWDHGYDLRGKRVAVIGTGASAIQFVPQIQKQVAQLDLYQRTPPWILPKPDRLIGEGEQNLFRNLPLVQQALRTAIYWMLETRVLGFAVNPRLMNLLQTLAVRHIHKRVKDPVLRAKLTPDYTIGCKRVLISNDYYPALTQPNVEVITTAIREIRPHSVVTTDGVERAVDCLIYGTGFKAQDPLPRGAIFGRGGQDILDAWKDGPEAYHGTTVAGFPNLFLLVGPNTGLGHSSMVFMIESQVNYVMSALDTLQARGYDRLEVRPEVQARYNQALQRRLTGAVWASGCKSWYVDANGRNTTLWPSFTFRFRQATRQLRFGDYRWEKTETATAVTA